MLIHYLVEPNIYSHVYGIVMHCTKFILLLDICKALSQNIISSFLVTILASYMSS